MYFDNVELFNIGEKVKNIDLFFAHTNKDEKEKLKAHLDLVYAYFLEIIEKKNLDIVFKKFQKVFLNKCPKETIELWKELICNAIYMHDVGKINTDFQYRKMKNSQFKDTLQIESNHSMLSSCIYFNNYFLKVKEVKGEARNILLTFLLINSYLISKHHGALDDNLFDEDKAVFFEGFENWLDEGKQQLWSSYSEAINSNVKNLGLIKKCIQIAKRTISKYESNQEWSSIDFYIYTKLMFSLLVAGDYYATSEYQNKNAVNDIGAINKVSDFYDIFKKSEIYTRIKNYKNYINGLDKNPYKSGDINELRTQLFLEAEENLIKNIKSNLFYLEAPTGSGKTIASINLAFKFLEKDKNINKIFYIFPFNTLVEQTKSSLDEIFMENEEVKRNIAIINSVNPIRLESEDENKAFVSGLKSNKTINYQKSLLNRQFLHYPIVLTTHVNLFKYLFGTRREEIFPLVHLANSVVILDEIQSYRNNIWKEIILFLKKYSELLNVKIIIMSATLPRLGKLTSCNDEIVSLIKDRQKYFDNPLFKERVSLDYSLLESMGVIKDLLYEKVIEVAEKTQGNILVEFIKKESALNFYEKLFEYDDKKTILLITGDDNKAERKKIISRVKNERNLILIATQVIEAGVDIDMDVGFKDISILDAEEQFLGRINRSCKKKGCKVYFFNLDEANRIYKGDYRKDKDITLIQNEMKDILLNKNFEEFYDLVINKLNMASKKQNDGNIDEFRTECVAKLKNKTIKDRMTLIEDRNQYTIFFNRTIELENGEKLLGSEVWEEYYRLLKDAKMGYAEKKVKLSEVNSKMDYFTYNIDRFSGSYDDILGDIIYIENGDKYFTNDKFDRAKLKKTDEFELI